ncbi:DUF1989 domain-containing protein [Flammeovirga aprica]|uniref:DUF1989 domain-containing protein n=1 Tax=Flammeovirga aprica JL-4 TaxID=694437 RepID=A0A7X9P2N6_9BACT|nr:DUF1989 domain-containing protein [Flammeovirga aprica]NME67867.1 DUF1989 domain-containing protein [Flammeovirga aprica JL-4]
MTTQNDSYNADIDPVEQFARGVKPNVEFYEKVRATKTENTRTLVYEDVLEKHTGNSFYAKAGQVIRIEQRPHQHNGRTQIADILFFTPDLEQWSDHLSTTAVAGFSPTIYGSLWTQSKFMEKIVTLVEDEYPYELLEDRDNGMKVNHMFFAAHCSPEYNMCAYGNDAVNMNSCHENFIQALNRLPAIAAIEDEAERIKKVQFLADRNDLNIFQPNQIIPDEEGVTRGKMFLSPSVPDGTAIEFYCEKDLYLVASNCPYADQNLPFHLADPNPIYIQVFETGIEPETQDHLKMVKGKEWEKKIYNKFNKGEKDISVRTPESFNNL